MRKYYRFVSGFRKFNNVRLTPEEAITLARSFIRQRVAAREDNFLNLVEKGIFQNAKSPYLKLLRPKQITLEDLKSWISRYGLEASLHALENEGVYFTVNEFKGVVPVKRNGVEFQCDERMFDNPFLSRAYEVQSGSTRSAGTRVQVDFDYLHQRSLYDALLLDTHGCLTAPVANWFPMFPGAPGINSSLRFAHIGNPVRRWFSQVGRDTAKVGWERNLKVRAIFALSKFYNNPLAEPEHVSLSQAGIVAEWASRMLQEHPRCVVYTFAASAVRVCIAASEQNLNLKGVRFLVTGEPLTAQKRREIESTGATPVPVYGISEAGVIAAGCNTPHVESDHCHLYKDTMAIITHKYSVPFSGAIVNSFLFTTLLYESPKLLLNVGMGDYGDSVVGSCACGLDALGMDVHIGNIRSYEKLTGEGVSFVDSDFIGIIEHKLPAVFGGKSADYQLVEEEDSNGLPRLHLLVSPQVGTVNEEEVVKTFMALLRNTADRTWAQPGTQMWNQSGMVRVVRDFPIPTASGKVLPFHLARSESRLEQNV
jgi:hypothetical protein